MFENIYERMKTHGMLLPASKVALNIQDAENILKTCFSHFFPADGNNRFLWLPEYDQVAEWLTDNKERGLFLYGAYGRGKSLLTRFVLPAILLEYMSKVVSVYDVQDMNKKLDEVLTKHIIALDDIGTEDVAFDYGNKRLAFAEIMDAAEKKGKLLIISTNLNGSELEKRYGKRVMERIISTTKRIEFKGKSLRK